MVAQSSVASTPTTADAMVQPNTKKAMATKPHKLCDSRAVAMAHEFEHRAKEKIGFGVAERVLAQLHTLTAPTTAVFAAEMSSNGLKPLSAMRKWITSAARRLKLVKPPAPPVAAPVSQFGVAARFSLDSVGVAMPLLGTYLLVHMAHHGWQRATREWRDQKTAGTTALFVVGALCDTFDACAHAVIAFILAYEWWLGRTGAHDDHHSDHHGHFDLHHLEHALHETALLVAFVAFVAMMLGEFLTKSEGGHGHEHGHKHKVD